MKNFEFSSFQRPPVKREYLPHDGIKEGDGVELELNLDLMTLEKMEEIDAEFQQVFEQVSEIRAEPEETALAIVDEKTDVDAEATKPVVKGSGSDGISLFRLDKAIHRFHARMLGGNPGEDEPTKRFIKGWNVVLDGRKLPVSYEAFVRLSKPQLDHLYNFVTGEASNPTKKKD